MSRALTRDGLEAWEALASSRFFASATAAGRIVETEQSDGRDDVPALQGIDAVAVLRHARVPVVSYPYEWPFGMLRDAALLQLELLRGALEEGLILKDSSPYNVQWRGARPVFIDVGSFERHREGEPWLGYRQFCMLFLYPLFLRAYKDIRFQPWLRGALDGISPRECRRLMSARDLLRPGVLTHVFLHSRLEERYGDRRRDVRGELSAAGFKRELILANVRRLEKVVRRLEWSAPPSEWSEYGSASGYSEEDAHRKEAFVRAVAGRQEWNVVWDLGCNDGRYSRIAADDARYVVAMDADEVVVERLYRSQVAAGDTRILPLVANVADPSPSLGWRGVERATLVERARPDLTLCLALVHHLAITHNVPLFQLLDWLAELGTALVIEFVDRDDPMVQRLLLGKRPGLHGDYDRDVFERHLGEAFAVERKESLSSSTRTLYLARPRR